MKITPELLQKYAESRCTDEEIKAIESWLGDAENEKNQLSSFQLRSMKKEVWERLTEQLSSLKVIPLHKRVYQYAAGIAAITVTGSALFFLLPQNPSHAKASFTNTSKVEDQRASSAGMHFLLKPESSLISDTELSEAISEMGFCGFVELTNSNQKDIQAKISSKCTDSPYSVKEIKLLHGEKYLLFTSTYKHEEVYVIHQKKLHELPLPLWNKVMDNFKIK